MMQFFRNRTKRSGRWAIIFVATIMACSLLGIGSPTVGSADASSGQARAAGASAPAFVLCPGTPEQCFTDVTSTNTFFAFANRIFKQGLVSGFPCGGAGEPCDTDNRPYYRPSAGVTRGQMAKFIDNARNQPGININVPSGAVPVQVNNSADVAFAASSVSSTAVLADSEHGVAIVATSPFNTAILATGGGPNTSAIEAVSSGEAAIVAQNDHGSGFGIDASSEDNYGVRARGDNVVAGGIEGLSQNGTGVRGASEGDASSDGIFGTDGNGTGVDGLSVNGSGVLGESNHANGVHGIGNSQFGNGVFGESSGANGHGVAGAASGGIDSSGIFGSGTNGSLAGYFSGNVAVNGTCCASAEGTYRIDDPTDPANKTLNQAAVESPDMMDIYSGNISTDANGDATITMPSWFQASTGDFRYQLTPIGQFAQAMVSSQLANNRFSIKTDKPGVLVSWQVTGIRQDAYANAHPITVEQNKPAGQQGKYLYPTEAGQPASSGVDYDTQQRIQQNRSTAPSKP